ncbi:MAG: CAP domain-containing protein, partial [Planctomycetota bacterium]
MRPFPTVAPHQLPSSIFAALFLIAAAAGQAPPEPQPDAAELPLLQTAAKELNAFATLAYKNGFPRRARDVWVEILAEYDRNDAVAREHLGYTAVGTAWQPKPGFDYPQIDEPNLKNAKMLDGKWQASAKRLGDGHRELATTLQAASKSDRAQYHFRRVLRFLPNDGKAQSGVGARTVEGVTGTDLELELLRRSRSMDRSIAALLAATYPVNDVAQTDPRLDSAGVKYTAVASENFVVFGDWEREVMVDIAQWSERSLAFCTAAFDGEAWTTPPEMTTKLAFFKDRAVWGQVVKANAAAIGDVDFVLQHTSACGIDRGKAGLFVSGQADVAAMIDYAVRKVGEQYSRTRRDAVVEGAGHAVVGLFFGRNLIMTVAEQKEGGTVAGRSQNRFELPDLEVWKELARDLAFEKASAPAAHLPLISVAKFSNEQRIKAWSFADYLLRRDPQLLLALDATVGDAKNDFDVMTAFFAATKLQLRDVEEDWRVFYTGDSAALRAIRDQVTPMDALSKDAPLWIEEFNRLRRGFMAKNAAWNADYSGPCKQHADYLEKNKVGREGENTQVSGKPLATNLGRLFAQGALISSGEKDPKKAMANWWTIPGFRDALFDRTLEQIGAYADGP